MTPYEMIPPPSGKRQSASMSPLGSAARWLGVFGLFAAGAVLVLAFVLFAATVALIGLVVGAGIVTALRLTAPSRRRRDSDRLLEGRRTATGWDVEPAPKPR
jgi:hypothetical protein